MENNEIKNLLKGAIFIIGGIIVVLALTGILFMLSILASPKLLILAIIQLRFFPYMFMPEILTYLFSLGILAILLFLYAYIDQKKSLKGRSNE